MHDAKYLVLLGSILPKGPMCSLRVAEGGGLSVVLAEVAMAN
jgi:hypothetical protein